MTHWKVNLATDNIFEADKFLPNSMNSNDQWTFDIGDFRYIIGDEINLYTMVEDGSYTIEWTNLEYRKLGGVQTLASLFVAAVASGSMLM